MKVLLRILAAGIMYMACLITVPFWQYTSVTEYVGEYVYKIQDAAYKAKYAAWLELQATSTSLAIPVIGVKKKDLYDSYGDPRTGGRRHEGIDIFAQRGTYVRSATHGIVTRIGYGELGGNFVYVRGPGGERFYYAHLDAIDPLLSVGDIVTPLTLIGRVGNTGNAERTPPHLHFGIYHHGAKNPYPRLMNS